MFTNFFQKILHHRSKDFKRSIVLMYHRINNIKLDPWKLSINTKNFESQLIALKKSKLICTTSIFSEEITSLTKMRPYVIITFDDGYEDNFLNAKPLLEKYEIPAIFFITTKHINSNNVFWWDELAEIILETTILPCALFININNILHSFELGNEQVLTKKLLHIHTTWNAYQKPRTRRSKLYLELWKLLSPLTYDQQLNVLHTLKQWAGELTISRKTHKSMSENQLRFLSECSLFSIGAHSVSHPLLTAITPEEQRNEISKSKLYIEKITRQKIDAFSYPSGNFNNTTINILKELDFKTAFTTIPKPVRVSDDPFQIGRFQVNNWNGNELNNYLISWR